MLIPLSLGLLPLQSATGAEGAAKTPYRDSVGTVAQLANETDEPFKYLGWIPREHHELSGYAGSVEQFPDVRSCLRESQRREPSPDLAAFDWEQLDDYRDAAVCIFRIASSYGSPDALEDWFRRQGFKISRRVYDGGLGRPGKFETVIVHAFWSIHTKGALFPSSALKKTLIPLLYSGLSVAVRMQEDGAVTSSIVLLQPRLLYGP